MAIVIGYSKMEKQGATFLLVIAFVTALAYTTAQVQVGRRFPQGISVGNETIVTCEGSADNGLIRFNEGNGTVEVCVNGTFRAPENELSFLREEVLSLQTRVYELETNGGSSSDGASPRLLRRLLCSNHGELDDSTNRCVCDCSAELGCWEVGLSCSECAEGATGRICQSDIQIPSIVINGATTVTIVQGDSYSDAGATITDNFDTVDTMDIFFTGLPIDVNVPGSYGVVYSAVDVAGNSNSAMRTVVVEDFDECLGETHNCHEHADCLNTIGSFECHCDLSNHYIGDGEYCELGLGLDQAIPAPSCVQIHQQWTNLSAFGQVFTRTFWIHPFSLSSPLQVYCDMDTDGGGWALVAVIDGNDQLHSNVMSVGTPPILPSDMDVQTEKLGDDVINTLLWYPAYGGIRFMCDGTTHFVKDCHWRATKELPSAADPCVTLYSDPLFNTVQDNTAGNEGSTGVGSHTSDPAGRAHTYCSHCAGSDGYSGHDRLGCGHDSSDYDKKGRLWVRSAVSDGCTASERSTAGCDENAICHIDNGTPTCSCNVGLGYIGSGTSCELARGNWHNSPALNCQDVFDQRSNLGLAAPADGQYWMQPAGISSPFQAYCSFEGNAGWTLVVTIDGNDEDHSDVGQVGTMPPLQYDYSIPVTKKFDDDSIRALLTNTRSDASIKFICDGYVHYVKNCDWRATKGLGSPDPCVNLYADVGATTLQSSNVCNAGSGALGAHCNIGSVPQNDVHTYCSHCDRADGAATHERKGCGHDVTGYEKSGYVWVR